MLRLKDLATLPSYFDYIFVHLKQKARFWSDQSPKFLSTSGPNPAGTRPEPDPKNRAQLTTLGRKVMRSSLEREVCGSNLDLVKSDTVLPAARHRCDISSKEAVLPTGAITGRCTPPTCYTLRRNATSTMKDLI